MFIYLCLFINDDFSGLIIFQDISEVLIFSRRDSV